MPLSDLFSLGVRAASRRAGGRLRGHHLLRPRSRFHPHRARSPDHPACARTLRTHLLAYRLKTRTQPCACAHALSPPISLQEYHKIKSPIYRFLPPATAATGTQAVERIASFPKARVCEMMQSTKST
eukprot:6177524-Pleurochrysis_carterae.AAC.3